MTNSELIDALTNFDTECNHHCSQCEFGMHRCEGCHDECPIEVAKEMIYRKENNREQYNHWIG